MIATNTLKDKLRDQAQEVCEHLFPHGRKVGNEFVIGSLAGEAGESLKINLNGKTGVWKDFASDEGGDNLLELWRAVRGCDFRQAADEIRAFLKLPDFNPRESIVRQGSKPRKKMADLKRQSTDTAMNPESSVGKYMIRERRLSEATLKRFRIAEGEIDKWGAAIVFPSKSADGSTTEMVKRVALKLDDKGKKVERTQGGEKILFGKHTCDPGGDLVIAEGEIDAMSWAEAGAENVVSVPYGANNHHWLENDLEWVDQFDRVLIAFDDDEAGQQGAAKLADRIGREKCWNVSMPYGCNDANEALQVGRITELAECYHNAAIMKPATLRNWTDFVDDALIYLEGASCGGSGFPTFFSGRFKIRPNEVTIWSGYAGHGKTAVLNQVIGDMCNAGERACIASMEISNQRTVATMIRQQTQREAPTREDVDAMNWSTDQVFIFDKLGDCDWREMLAAFLFAFRAFGVTQFVIDSLTLCGIDTDDYNQQRKFMDALAQFARNHPVHVHLVAHSRKGDEANLPEKIEVHGSSSIGNLADNGITVWRNKKKEKGLEDAKSGVKFDPDKVADLEAQPDARIVVWKQRESDGSEPRVFLRFDNSLRIFSVYK